MVEAAGVELFKVLTQRNLLIPRLPKRANKATIANSIVRLLYENHLTSLSGNGYQEPSIARLAAVGGGTRHLDPNQAIEQNSYDALGKRWADADDTNTATKGSAFLLDRAHNISSRGLGMILRWTGRTISAIAVQ